MSYIGLVPYEHMGVLLAARSEWFGGLLCLVFVGNTMLTSAPVSMRKSMLEVVSSMWSRGVWLPAEKLFNLLAFCLTGRFSAVLQFLTGMAVYISGHHLQISHGSNIP